MNYLVLVLLSIFTGINLSAYRLNNVAQHDHRWQQFPVAMKLNPDKSGLSDSEVERVIEKAMNTWNSGAGKTILTVETDKSIQASEVLDSDDINAIGFSNNFAVDTNGGFDPDVVVAIGGQYGQDGRMMDGFVLFNSQMVGWNTDKENSSSFHLYTDDLETVVLHELGHVLGLGHSELNDAVMSTQRLTNIRRELTQDDIDGAIYLTSLSGGGAYSKNSYRTAGCGHISQSKPGNGNLIMLLIMLIPVVGLLIYRLRLTAKSVKLK
jgi:hypothetical protein